MEHISVVLGAFLGVMNSVVCITYLGPTFDSKPALDVNDWRRKFLLFFAWFNVVYLVVNALALGKRLTLGYVLPLALSIMSQIVIIIYLGPTFEHSEKIDSDDWRRKFTLFFAWLGVAMVGVSVLPLLAGGVAMYAGIKSSEYSKLI